MSGQCFTVELIVEGIRGPDRFLNAVLAAGDGAADSLGSASPSATAAALAKSRITPALGLRILDLPHAVIEAPEGEVYGTRIVKPGECHIAFGGRGKALMFEVLEDSDAPLPLWLMALVKRPAPDAPFGDMQAQSGTPTAAAASAVLLASACVDLLAEVRACASRGARHSNAVCAFRRCSFQLVGVHDACCSVVLDCYFRVYAGSHQPLAGGELLLEPARWQDEQQEPEEHLQGAGAGCAPATASEKVRTRVSIGVGTEQPRDSGGIRAESNLAEAAVGAGPLPGCSEFRLSWRKAPDPVSTGAAYFPTELRVSGRAM